MSKRFYITTAIPYVNADPHIGHALEFVQADVLARYHRLLGKDVYFLTGTDENGMKILRTARQLNKDVGDLANDNSQKFRELTKVLNISNDDFIRTSDRKRHYPTAQKIWLKLEENGDIYKKKYKGSYCMGHESFLAKRDLEEGLCPIHKIQPEELEEENYFFRLSKYEKKLKEILEKNILKIVPGSRKNELLNLIGEGLEDVSFSRPRNILPWGVPVPNDETHTMYVWCDALTNYISALGYYEESTLFKETWPADIHVIGKDITRFHALIWPAMLFSAGLELPKILFIHGFVTSEGEKMSKSLGNVVDPFAIVEKYGVDTLRYYLLKEIPATEDGDFSIKKFEEVYNADLADGIGNLVSRVLTLAEGAEVRKVAQERNVADSIGDGWQLYKEEFEKFQFHNALNVVGNLIGMANSYINKEEPWKRTPEKQEKIVGVLLGVVVNLAWMLEPFLSSTADKIFEQLGLDKNKKEDWQKIIFEVSKKENLFPKLK